MLIAFAHFLALYLIAGTFTRLIVMKFPDTSVARALAFAHA